MDTPTPTPVLAAPDPVGPYAAKVREQLVAHRQKGGAGMTVTEICDALSLGERRVREALARLAYTGDVRALPRHTPGQRGAMPLAYSLVAEPRMPLLPGYRMFRDDNGNGL